MFNKLNTVKSFVKDHKDTIAVLSAVTTITGGLTWAAAKGYVTLEDDDTTETINIHHFHHNV